MSLALERGDFRRVRVECHQLTGINLNCEMTFCLLLGDVKSWREHDATVTTRQKSASV